MRNFKATESMRLDVFLAKAGVVNRVQARELVKNGFVLVNGRIARKPALVLQEGDTVEASETLKPVTETRLAPADIDLPVLYEDDSCMVILKPAGISVHPGAGMNPDAETILHGIVRLFQERDVPFSSSAVLVHRLDKDTTGCLLVAKTPQAHKLLQQQFADRTVRKIYLALVMGVPDPPAAVIDATIGRSTSDRTKMSVIGAGKSREARTTYRTIATGDGAALLTCELHTGRTHQIRVHMKTVGHPLLGDPVYATPKSAAFSEHLGIGTICLHAWKLTFHSPADGKEHEVRSPMPQSFQEALVASGIDVDSVHP